MWQALRLGGGVGEPAASDGGAPAAARGAGGAAGGALQVDPIKLTLKAPGSERLKLKYDEPLSNVAFKFNLRRCTLVGLLRRACAHLLAPPMDHGRGGLDNMHSTDVQSNRRLY